MPSAAHSLDQFVRFVVLRYAPAFLGIALLVLFGAAKELPPIDRFESQIKKFEAEDKEAPPPSDAILFVGSSSIRLWDLKASFPGLPAINRGFGGSFLRESTYYAERIVIPYKPKVIVLYAGDNDIASGITADELLGDYKKFVEKIHASLPDTHIVFLSIKPSVSRWALYDEQKKANGLVNEFSKADKRLHFVDLGAPLLGADGKPRADLLLKDGLHLNEAGYAVWTSVLTPVLNGIQS
ncbi:MAG TPA: SGNH/GDSL hydrolase family protein [Candidatus Hydrogenedentes bacterium]|nr:SGNH/GDSL hydrolase family protein [Candidatus Hydrogenedentota bacterium]HRK34329.1 SGNH/GDSL hydrolase family protein [Candidatus Hydrogenedentota bacterium]